MLRYLFYRKYDVAGLLALALGLYLSYKTHSIAGIVENPLTGKKSLVCLNREH